MYKTNTTNFTSNAVNPTNRRIEAWNERKSRKELKQTKSFFCFRIHVSTWVYLESIPQHHAEDWMHLSSNRNRWNVATHSTLHSHIPHHKCIQLFNRHQPEGLKESHKFDHGLHGIDPCHSNIYYVRWRVSTDVHSTRHQIAKRIHAQSISIPVVPRKEVHDTEEDVTAARVGTPLQNSRRHSSV